MMERNNYTHFWEVTRWSNLSRNTETAGAHLYVCVCVLHSEVIVALLQQRGSHAPPGGANTPGHWALQTVILQILAVLLLLAFLIFLVILVHIDLAVFSLKQQAGGTRNYDNKSRPFKWLNMSTFLSWEITQHTRCYYNRDPQVFILTKHRTS